MALPCDNGAAKWYLHDATLAKYFWTYAADGIEYIDATMYLIAATGHGLPEAIAGTL